MVRYEELFDMVHGATFSPFRIFTTDGQVFDIVRKFNNVVTRSFIAIGIPRPDDTDPFPIARTTVHVPIASIERVEFLPAKQGTLQG
jgi:hypothetical protein